MATEEQFQVILNESANAPKDQQKFRVWFLEKFSNASIKRCNLEDFAIYFLHMLRQHTELHLRVNESETPKSQTPIRSRPVKESTPDSVSMPPANSTPKQRILLNTPQTPIAPTKDVPSLSLSISEKKQVEAQSPNVNHALRSAGFDRSFTAAIQNSTSTPPRQQQQQKRVTPGQLCNTPNNSYEQRNNSGRHTGGSGGFCLGDFIVSNSPPHHNRSKHKKAAQQQHQETPTGKPKKRVVPTTISNRTSSAVTGNHSNTAEPQTAATPFGTAASAFRNENNLLKLADTEIVDRNQCAILEARKSLKHCANEISKQLAEQQQHQLNLSELTLETTPQLTPASIERRRLSLSTDLLSQVNAPKVLELFASIYVLLIDMNLTANVLGELAYVLNLLNAQEPTNNEQQLAITNAQLTLLSVFPNCLYFALNVLQQQQDLLALLDVKSLGVVLNGERFSLLSNDVQRFLETVYQHKQQLSTQQTSADTSIRFDNSFKNVYYHHDKDSREHFTSANEFSAFKTQRDLFYTALKYWESNHLNSNWNFSTDLTPHVREIFRQSEHPINMAHFSKLFVAQLLVSASDVTTIPQELGVEMDMQKFSKLTQRLVAPSNFSVDYQFPRTQAFFRDFINDSGSIAFLEQLKLGLYAQLIELNNSTFEQLQLYYNGANDDEYEPVHQLTVNTYIVRTEVLASMLILAKFLGYVTALPYSQQQPAGSAGNSNNVLPLSVSQQQLQLRNLFQPNFNICELIKLSIIAGKLLITLPWLVQYLAMLDNVTLQLECYKSALHLIFTIYSHMGMKNDRYWPMHTSGFIVRSCIGWLMETKSHVAEEYYDYRSTLAMQSSTMNATPEMQQLINALVSSLQTVHASKSPYKGCKELKELQFHPLLEGMLNVACPFLAEFRVSIMPAKYALTKSASRTGRYRHITTRYAELPAPSSSQSPRNGPNVQVVSPQEIQQNKLVEAFLHSQHGSMRRLIEFIIERTYKSVVKDIQQQILLPSKSTADSEVNEIVSTNYHTVMKEIIEIYGEARDEAHRQWQTILPHMIDERVEKALTVMLPAATSEVIKQTYFLLIRRNSTQKTQQWLQTHVILTNFYCSDLHEMTLKVCKANKTSRQSTASSELRIVHAEPSVSDLLDDLQYWLHITSLRPDLVTTPNDLYKFVARIPCVMINKLPTVFYHLVGSGLVQLFHHIIPRHPSYLTDELIDMSCGVWLTPEMQHFIQYIDGVPDVPGLFDALVTAALIDSLGTQHLAFEKLQLLLVAMIKTNLITVDFVNELFVPIFKENYRPEVFNEISVLLRNVAMETANLVRNSSIPQSVQTDNNQDNDHVEDEAKSNLFMEVLADLSRDLDCF